MPDKLSHTMSPVDLRQKALSRWENEGGAKSGPREELEISTLAVSEIPSLTNSEASFYKVTPVFDQDTLPAGLRREHRTKPGVWGVIRVLEGRLRYEVIGSLCEVIILEPGHPGLVLPEQPHRVEPLGPLKMQVEFYRQAPKL